MRKIVVLSVAAAVACVFASCSEKEGVYSPSKKIANIYESSASYYQNRNDETGEWINDTAEQPKTLAESWTWDGEKLAKIVLYEVGNVNEKGEAYDEMVFTYNGKQVTRIEGNDEYVTFGYDGKLLKEAKLYDKTGNTMKPQATFAFERKDGRVSRIVVTGDMESMMDGDMDMQRVLFRTVLPTVEHADRAVAVMAKAVERTAGAKVEMSIPMELTWTGDNVTGFTLNIAGMMSASGKYSFDDKANPYQNFLFGIVDMMEGGPMYFNKNNVVKAEMTMTTLFGPLTDVVSYAYTYDGDWPLTQTSTTVEDEEDGEYRSEHVTTRYFEYR